MPCPTSSHVCRSLLALLLLSGVLLVPAAAGATTWHVDNSVTTLSLESSTATFTDVQDAIDAASSGDTIFIHDGTYYGHAIPYVDPTCGNCNDADYRQDIPVTLGFSIRGKALHLVGESRQGTVLHTDSGYGVFFENAGSSSIENLTVTGGERTAVPEATDGAVVARYTTLVIRDLDIEGNESTVYFPPPLDWYAGIVGVVGREGANLTIEDCLIQNNSWDGVSLYRSDPAVGQRAQAVLRDNVIAHGPERRGAAVGITWDAKGTLIRNTIHDWQKGVGVFGAGSEATLKNNVIHSIGWWGFTINGDSQVEAVNNVVHGAGTAVWSTHTAASVTLTNNVVTGSTYGVEWITGAQPDFRYNDVWGNGTDLRECAGGSCTSLVFTGADGNIMQDPRFTDPGGHDYRLLCGSPALDAGDPGIQDVDGSRSDMGAYGGPLSAEAPPTCTGDCRAQDGDVTGCNATSGCAYYYCSGQCHPVGTSNCAAGCTGYCDCRAHDGDVSGCNATAGCAYYYCSNQCHPVGTSNCDAGCTGYCDCRAQDGDVTGCNATAGCAYYYCSNQCHPVGTSNCDAGCTSYCGCRAHDGDVTGCDATSGCAYYFCSDQCHPVGTSNCDAGCTGYC